MNAKIERKNEEKKIKKIQQRKKFLRIALFRSFLKRCEKLWMIGNFDHIGCYSFG